MKNNWRWALAVSIGSSHINSQLECQDHALCKEFNNNGENILVAVVADGAGSAKEAKLGARINCNVFMKAAKSFLNKDKDIFKASDEDVNAWIDEIREILGLYSKRKKCAFKELAATFIAVIIGKNNSLIIHIGDGAVVMKENNGLNWDIVSYPFHGEYASTTTFMTDDILPNPNMKITRLDKQYCKFAIFSDGIERIVLNLSEKTAHQPFFNSIIAPLEESSELGKDKKLSKYLKDYLDSETVLERTDDDKKLLLGVLI
jgi:hypothetical protein